MTTHHSLLNLINDLSLSDRLMIVEAVLKGIREVENRKENEGKLSTEPSGFSGILSMAGIWTEAEAKVSEEAITECRNLHPSA
jgi:hypothetical protein